MRWKIPALLTCVLLLVAVSIPGMQCSLSKPVLQNNVLSQITAAVPEGGSVEWQKKLDNAVGRCIAVTQNESYIYVGGAYWTDPTNSSTWKPTLWKYTNSGSQVWSTDLDIQYYYVAFYTLALSPDESAVYAGGLIPNATGNYDGIVVKFNASNGDYIWNCTLSGPWYDCINALEVSPDGEIVYFAGSLSKPSTAGWNTSFYVGAINTSNGALEWDYDLFVEGTNYGSTYDLVLSPSGEALYAAGYHTVSGWLNSISLVALNTTDHSQLWNLTSDTLSSISYIEISSDGNSIYTISSLYPSYRLITINSSNGGIMENVSISNSISPTILSLSFNESMLYVLTQNLQAFGQNLRSLMVELDFSGNVKSVLLAPNNQLTPQDLAPSNDNVSVYVVASIELYPSATPSLWIIKGQAGPIPLPLIWLILPLLITYSQITALPTQINSTLIGVGIAVALALLGLLISKKLIGGLESV